MPESKQEDVNVNSVGKTLSSPEELTWFEAVVRQMVSDAVGVLVVAQEAILGLAEGACRDISSTGNVPNT